MLLHRDGRAVAFGVNYDGQCDVPEPVEGIFYTQVAAGNGYTVGDLDLERVVNLSSKGKVSDICTSLPSGRISFKLTIR